MQFALFIHINLLNDTKLQLYSACILRGYIIFGYRVVKNGTQTNINNFFINTFLTLKITQIKLQYVQIVDIKGFFDTQQGKKVMHK